MSHYKPYPAYKETSIEWLGMVPERWAVKKVSAICKLRNGYPFDSQAFQPFGQQGSRLIRIRDLAPVESQIFTDENCPESAIVNDGDLLIGMDGDFNIVRWDGGKAKLNQRVCALNAKSEAECKFILYALPSPLKIINDLAYSTTVKHLSSMEVLKTQVAIPSDNDELESIVAHLDRETARIDALVEKKTRFLELLREKRQAIITHAVTKGLDPNVPMKNSGVEWLGEVPEHWTVLSFQRRVYIAEGQVNPEEQPYADMMLIAPNHIESGTGRLLYTETAAEQMAESGKYLCREGDVIYSKIRPALRKACIAPADCLCSADMYPLRGDQSLLNHYLLWFLLSEPFSAFAVLEADRVAMPKINRESLNALKLALPPVEEQEHISRMLTRATTRIDALIEKTERSIELLKEHRSALITAAVTGKMDLRDTVAAPSQIDLRKTA